MQDYKEILQQLFEQLCEEEHGTSEYWTLPNDEQSRLYRLAERQYADMLADRADYIRKQERESR